ncbi:MAG: hemerythrin family protein [Magnetococcales bacterium]|nr:hemerythrin family protein [Magnetococcales bacterium]
MNNDNASANKPKEKSLLQLMDEVAVGVKDPGQLGEHTHADIEEQIFSKLQRIGLQAIDRQHEMLVRHLCNLYKVMIGIRSRAPNKEEAALLQVTLEGLQDYTVKHFQDEESYMAYIGFPEVDGHIKIHQDFIEKFLTIKKAIQARDLAGVDELFFLVYRWLFDHINRDDAKIAQFYNPN